MKKEKVNIIRQANFRLPDDLIQLLKTRAELERRSLNKTVQLILENSLKEIAS